jgi:hypothetical protein
VGNADITLQCNYNPEDGRGPSWNKQAIESHKSLEKNLLATNEALLSQLAALKSYIRQLGGSPPPELTQNVEVKDDVQALCEQTRHLVVSSSLEFASRRSYSIIFDSFRMISSSPSTGSGHLG